MKTVRIIVPAFFLFSIFSFESFAEPTYESDVSACTQHIMAMGKVTITQLVENFSEETKLARFLRVLARRTHPDQCEQSQKDVCHKTFIRTQECLETLQELFRKVRETLDATAGCMRNGGIWDNKNGCLNKETSACGHATSELSCHAFEAACVWDAKGQVCLSNLWMPCSIRQTEYSCEWGAGCVWDIQSQSCLSAALSNCALAHDSETCARIFKCRWDLNSGACAKI